MESAAPSSAKLFFVGICIHAIFMVLCKRYANREILVLQGFVWIVALALGQDLGKGFVLFGSCVILSSLFLGELPSLKGVAVGQGKKEQST